MTVRRVLMTTDTVGGVWTYSLDLARWLGKRGVEVVLAAMGQLPSDRQVDEAIAIPNVDFRERGYKLEWMSDPWRDVDECADWLLRIAREAEPDVVHLNQLSFGGLPWSAPSVVVGHSCVLSWWQAVRGEFAGAEEWRTYAMRVGSSLQAADLVVAPSRAMMSCLQEHYGPLRRTRVIPNARSSDDFAPGAKLPYILAAGRAWDEAKGFDTLDLAARRSTWPVLVAGDGAEPRHCRGLGQIAPAALQARMSEASVFCHPARYEPFGLSVLEAAMCGCALVLGDIDSLRENWSGAAIFVPIGDADALAGVLNRLAVDDDLRRDLARRALARSQRFSPHDTTDAYLHAYQTAGVRKRAVLL